MRLKMCVYAIAKNETKHVVRFCESAKDADLVVIADTGSSDDTMDLAKQCNAHIYKVHIEPWRFDTARDTVLSLVPADIDVCISLDLDEILTPEWRSEIERIWISGTDALQFMYDWGDGLVFPSNKIHSRNGWMWKGICHETLFQTHRTHVHMQKTEKVLIKHLQDSHKPRSTYLDLLAAGVKEKPTDAKTKFYYARELGFSQKYSECIKEFANLLAYDCNTLTENEIVVSYILIAKCYDILKNHSNAVMTFDKAVTIAPNNCDLWMSYAESCCAYSEWEMCYVASKRVLEIPIENRMSYISDPDSYGAKPYNLAAISAWKLHLVADAIKYGKQAYDLEPNNMGFEKNYLVYSTSFFS